MEEIKWNTVRTKMSTLTLTPKSSHFLVAIQIFLSLKVKSELVTITAMMIAL